VVNGPVPPLKGDAPGILQFGLAGLSNGLNALTALVLAGLVAAADEPGLKARTGPAEALARGKSAPAISAVEATIDRHGQDISCLVLALGPRPGAGAAMMFRRPAERSRSRLPGPSGVLMVFSSGRALLRRGTQPTPDLAHCHVRVTWGEPTQQSLPRAL
jgi:hypothetical protein